MMSELLEHLGRQIESSRRMLGVVLRQASAIRTRDVDTVLQTLAELQAEMLQRAKLEDEREGLLDRAADRLDRPVGLIDLDAMLTLEPRRDQDAARALSAELTGLLAEIQRVHDQNRVLIRQELSFLDHLMRMLSGTIRTGYSPAGTTHAPQLVNAVNARA
jgi:flagellar biosynthesis/type III secretory pathway chaperone